jgi:hypothetical protein
MLRDAATGGFDVTLEDGRLLRIPPGRVRVIGGLRNVDVDRSRMEGHLQDLDPLGDSTSRKLFPFARVRAATISPGDQVEVLGEVTTAANDDAAGYRSAAFVVAPVGVPVLRVRTAESLRRRVDVGSGTSEQQEADDLAEDEAGR